MSRLLGITRERVYSPGKVEEDRAILEAVADRLRSGHEVRVVSGEEPLPETVEPDTLVFAMCQGPSALAALWRWESAGVRVVNSSASILNCHRRRMRSAFARAQVLTPPAVLVATDTSRDLPEWAGGGVWVKRGDVHATEAADVVFAATADAVAPILGDFHGRGIATALVQQHVAGEVIKFYAVRGEFFAWFSDAPLELSAAEVERMRATAEAGAGALGVEVFGGDCVRAAGGRFPLIDLNDWPSYSRCRIAAARAIATYLEKQAQSSSR